MTSKIEAVSGAYSRLRISGITVNPTAGHVQKALARLEDMMSELSENRNICVNYNFEDFPDANTEMGVTRGTINMIESNLAIRLIPEFNKIVPQALTNDANQSLSAVVGRVESENMRDVQPSHRMPIGSGNRYNERYQRFNHPQAMPAISCKSIKMNVGEVDDFVEHFDGYLRSEAISNFTIEASNGLTINTSSNNDKDIFYNVTAKDPAHGQILQSVLITITTDTNRIEIRRIDFEITKLELTKGSN